MATKKNKAYIAEGTGPQHNGVEILFESRPASESTDALKALGCVWNRWPRSYTKTQISGLRGTKRFAGAWYVRGFQFQEPSQRTAIVRELSAVVKKFNAAPTVYQKPKRAAKRTASKRTAKKRTAKK